MYFWGKCSQNVLYGFSTQEYAKSQFLSVCSGLHLVTYLDMGNFCDKTTETTLHEICVVVFLRFADSSKPSQPVFLINEWARIAGINKSEENLLKTSCKVGPPTTVAHILMTSRQVKPIGAREYWCDVSCKWNHAMFVVRSSVVVFNICTSHKSLEQIYWFFFQIITSIAFGS